MTRFTLGQVVATPAAIESLGNVGVAPATLLDRHAAGDWGEVHPEDKAANDQALIDEIGYQGRDT